ncbi:MAG: hypothetical protein HKP27_11990, partial [Myxococcales bacterium]|nr:hypothetical protein [Myxococcales bacterium]
RVLRKFQATGRFEFFPTSEYHSDGSVTSRIDPSRRVEIEVRDRLVDATYLNVQVPSIRPPSYEIEDGASVVPINGLAHVGEPYRDYVVVGAGKTGIDAVLFLIDQGVDPGKIRWIVPNDSWFLDRPQIQPGRIVEFFVAPFDVILKADTVDDVFHGLEADQQLLRLDSEVWPAKYRCATVNRDELAKIRSVGETIRLGRVNRILRDAIELEAGTLPSHEKTLYADCTADGLARRPVRPVFEAGRITLQSLVMCQQVFSASVIGHVAGMKTDDADRNALCGVVPHPEVPHDFLLCNYGTFRNVRAWAPRMPLFLDRNRLNFGHHDSLTRRLRLAWTLFRDVPGVMEHTASILGKEGVSVDLPVSAEPA